MSKEPSDATKLRSARTEVNELSKQLRESRLQAEAYRIRATKAEQECAEWKVRFDKLLERTPKEG